MILFLIVITKVRNYVKYIFFALTNCIIFTAPTILLSYLVLLRMQSVLVKYYEVWHGSWYVKKWNGGREINNSCSGGRKHFLVSCECLRVSPQTKRRPRAWRHPDAGATPRAVGPCVFDPAVCYDAHITWNLPRHRSTRALVQPQLYLASYPSHTLFYCHLISRVLKCHSYCLPNTHPCVSRLSFYISRYHYSLTGF